METEVKQPESGKGFGEIFKELCGLVKSKFAGKVASGGNNGWFKDFCGFKIMILPVIVSALWILVLLGSLIGCIVMMFKYFGNGEILSGIGCIILLFLIPFITHIFFEFFMLPFAILNMLKEIRDKISDE